MRLSDLLGKVVVDAAGQTIGKVTEVPLVREGPDIGGFGPSYVVASIRVSRRAWNYFGYEREDAGGPAPVRWFFRMVHRGDTVVTWDEIAEIGSERITLRSS